MRTPLLCLLLFAFFSCHSQEKFIESFKGRFYILGESPYPVYKHCLIEIKKDTLLLNTGSKSTIWVLNSFSERKEDETTIDSYESFSDKGIPTTVRLIYERDILVDVVFLQGLISYHFFIANPYSI